MKGGRDGNQQKRVQQETAYSAVVVINDHMYPRKDPFWVKNDVGTGIHMITLQLHTVYI